jgi:WXXGXW repeat (2 copies)
MKTFGMRFLFSALVAGALISMPAGSLAQISIGISINIEPPALPVYVQPPCPQPNYMWTPGYWAWDGVGDYYWVPGTWVLAPQPGYLWTPGYWGWGDGGVYVFNAGYWGTQVGFYGGVNYGFGYGGGGFAGGEWRGGVFAYNTAAVNVNTTVIHTTYVNTTIVNNTTIINNTHTSFNGGPNGVAAKPTPQQQAFASQPHLPATPAQQQHEQVAKEDKSNFASVNHGVPAHAAVARPVTSVAELQHSAIPAKPAPGAKPYVPHPAAAAKPAARPAEATPPASKASAPAHPAPTNTRPAPHSQPEAKPAPASPRPETTTRPAQPPAPSVHPKEPPPEQHPEN